MILNVQMAIIVGIPLLMIYTTIIFSYGYRKGYKEGFDAAMHIRDIDEQAESEE